MTFNEAIKRLKQESCPATYMPDFNKEECLQVIEKEHLKAIRIKKQNERFKMKIKELQKENGDLKQEVADLYCLKNVEQEKEQC